jgi:hypothetical protein
MSRESLVFVFGLLTFLIPFLGLPRDFKEIGLLVIGGSLMLLGVMLRRSAYLRSIEKSSGERQADEFTESGAASTEPEVFVTTEEALPV